MSSEASLPKEFKKITEVLPFTKYGLSSMQEFQEAKAKIHQLERLKRLGLSDEEIKLYEDNEAGVLDQQKKVDGVIMKKKLDILYRKIELADSKRSHQEKEYKCNMSSSKLRDTELTPQLPDNHPLNHIKELENDLFGHLNSDLPPLAKRMKMLRRFEKKKMLADQQIAANSNICIPINKCQEFKSKFTSKPSPEQSNRPNDLKMHNNAWNMPGSVPKDPNYSKLRQENEEPGVSNNVICNKMIGPKRRQLYTIKDGSIVRLEPDNKRNPGGVKYRAVDIVFPENRAEEQLLEGTKMTIDNIKKIERFKNYEPGIPSKSLYLKNVAPAVSEEQLSLLFNQFIQANGGPIRVKLMKTGRMRGQAFVDFEGEEVAVEALTEVNGTILCGRPLIAHFARHVQTGPPG